MCPGMSLPVGGAHSTVNATVSVLYCVMTALGRLVTALANNRHGEPVQVVVRTHAQIALGGQHPLLCCLKKVERLLNDCGALLHPPGRNAAAFVQHHQAAIPSY